MNTFFVFRFIFFICFLFFKSVLHTFYLSGINNILKFQESFQLTTLMQFPVAETHRELRVFYNNLLVSSNSSISCLIVTLPYRYMYRTHWHTKIEIIILISFLHPILFLHLKNNPFMTSVLGNFYVKSNSWGKNGTTSLEGFTIAAVTSKCELYKLIQEPNHILESPSSCIDIIFCLKKNLINFIPPSANNIFDIHNPYGIKLLIWLCLGFSQF